MLIREAVAALGYEEDDSQELCVSRFQNGRIEQRTLAQCGHRELGGLKDVYIRAGAFRPGSIKPDSTGSTRQNLARVYDLAFDFDLTDYTGMGRDGLLESSEHDLEMYLRGLLDDAGEVLGLCEIPVTTWVSTGYGLLALSRLAAPDQTRVDAAAALHAVLVARINEVHGSRLADPQVNDGGTRLIRLPGCVNTKGNTPRPCVILHDLDGDEPLHIDAFPLTSRPHMPPRRLIPEHAKGLDKETEDAIVLALTGEWAEGSRHGIALGIAGLLAKSAIPRTQTERIIERVTGDDPESRDRLRAVRTTYARIERGLEVKGYTHLKSFLSPDVLAYVDARLDTVRTTGRVLGEIEFMPETRELDALSQRVQFPPCPEEAFYGWFGRYRDLMKPTTEACDAYHLATALVYAGLLIGKRVGARQQRVLYPNLYVTLVGKTGLSRKDTAISLGNGFFTESHNPQRLVSVPFSTLRGVASSEGLVDYLIDAPRTLMVLSELSLLWGKARQQATMGILGQLTYLWDTPSSAARPIAGGAKTADNPFLSLLSATTPATLADEITGAEISSGFANRVLWVYGEASEEGLPDPPDPDRARGERLYDELREAIGLYAPGTILKKTVQARGGWDSWYHQNRGRGDLNPVEAEMAQRISANIHKIAGIYATSAGSEAIDDVQLGAATVFVEWCFASTRIQSQRWGWGEEARLGSDILDFLDGGPQSNLHIAEYLGRRVSATQIDRVLASQVKVGLLCICAPGIYRRVTK